MTIIVGIRSKDSVVVAADSAATYGALGQQTVAQRTDRKIEIIDNRAILAVSGPIGLGQRFRGVLESLVRDNKRLKGVPWQVMTEIRKEFWPHIETELRAAAVSVPLIGPQAASSSALSSSLVGLATANGPTLIQFDSNGAPEEATEQLPFVCIGSGHILGDPFLAFIKDVFWTPGSLPELQDAIFAALWTIDQSISIAPGGIGGTAHVATLTGNGQKYVARELEPSELDEHRQAIEAAKASLRSFKDFSADPPTPPPEPPRGEVQTGSS
jgi:hypothetical protein